MNILKLKQVAAGAVVSATLSLGLQSAEIDFRTDINPALLYFQAFQVPKLSESDANYLFDWPGSAWPKEPLEERRVTLLKQFDSAFKLLRRARFSTVECDWGYDLSDGPEALLPGLAPAKRLAQAARLRAAIALQENRFEDVREEFAATFTLARNLARDHILISCLVQDAMENLLTSIVMANYYRFSAAQLDEFVRAMDAAPKRVTMAETIAVTERDAFFGYVQRKVSGILNEANGKDEVFWTKFERFWDPIVTESESGKGPDPSSQLCKQAAGGSPTQLIKLLNEMPHFYDETARVLSLPYPEYKKESPVLFKTIENSKNPFIRQFFSVFKNVRAKEFSVMVRQEMVRAAAAYKSGGNSALDQVRDPLTDEKFEFTRADFDGVDRGFRLRCKEQFRDFDEVMTFIEKPGPHFQLDGKNAGSPVKAD